MDNSFSGFVQDIFNTLRTLPLFYDHYDKLFAVLAVLLVVYFVGAMARNLLIGALVLFLLWGFRYQDAGESQHVNRYTGAVCDVARECWQPERARDFHDRSYDRSYERSSYR